MASIVKAYDKKTGKYYAYRHEPKWDPVKKRDVGKRVCIGIYNPENGEITSSRNYKQRVAKDSAKSKESIKNNSSVRVRLDQPVKVRKVGGVHLLDQVTKELGLDKALEKVFPHIGKDLLALAYHAVISDRSDAYTFPEWNHEHMLNTERNLSSQTISEIYKLVSDVQIEQFFKEIKQIFPDEEYYAYDTTSISSYSTNISYVEKGVNKDHLPLKQINMLLIVGEKTGLPAYYRILDGNTPDNKTVRVVLAELYELGYNCIFLVFDRGFYSYENVERLIRDEKKTIVGTRINLNYIKKSLSLVRDKLELAESFDEELDIRCVSIKVGLDKIKKLKTKPDDIQKAEDMEGVENVTLHFFLDKPREIQENHKVIKSLKECLNEYKQGSDDEDVAEIVEKFFEKDVYDNYFIKNDEVDKLNEKNGVFVLLTNTDLSSREVLKIYRKKDVVEKVNEHYKDDVDCDRLRVKSDATLRGKMFVKFLAIIYVSQIEAKLRKYNETVEQVNLSKRQIFAKLEKINKIRIGDKEIYSEILSDQIKIFNILGYQPPKI